MEESARRQNDQQKEKILSVATLCAGLLGVLYLFSVMAHAASSFEVEIAGKKNHVTADRVLYHSNDKVYEAFGRVVVGSRGQRMTADYAWIDLASNEVRARGNVILVTPTSIVNAAELHFNIVTGAGTIFYGRVTNDFYTMKGQLIRKLSDERFLTTDGEYTTCRDCAESWKLAAKSVDLTVEGYAFMQSVFITIKDTPTLYVPYLVFPVKRERQSGLLFPRISTGGNHGFIYVQPLFLVIDDHQDLTLSYGIYSKRGRRMEFEYRYNSYPGIEGTFNAFSQRDRSDDAPRQNRYAVKTENKWGFFPRAKFLFRYNDISDNEYPRIIGDIHGTNEMALESNLVSSSPFDNFFVGAEVKRYRNLVNEHITSFDNDTVQVMPGVHFGTKERYFGPLGYSVYGRFDNFYRSTGSFNDQDGNRIFNTGTSTPENLREAQRLMVTPTISAPFSIGRALKISPSVEYNHMAYNFKLPTANTRIDRTERQYVVGRVDASAVLERVYDYDGERIIKWKHQFIPKIGYSNIPWNRDDPNHPFSKQIERKGGPFDQFDVVPTSNSTNFLRLPLGNAINYGFSNAIIRKARREEEVIKPFPYDVRSNVGKKYPAPYNKKSELSIGRDIIWDKEGPDYSRYSRLWDLTVDQAYDFLEARSSLDKKRAFSRLQAVSSLTLDNFSNSITYRYYPREISGPNKEVFSNVHEFSTNFGWTLVELSNPNGTLFFRRNINLGYTNTSRPTSSRSVDGSITWSLNDFFTTQYSHSFNLIQKLTVSQSGSFIYSSPSECWQIGLRYSRSYEQAIVYSIDFGVNLFGSGYMGLNQVGQRAGMSPIDLGPLSGGRL